MPSPRFLTEYAQSAGPLLAQFLEQRRAQLPDGLAAPLVEYVQRGGKRLRGALVLLGCEAAGGAPPLAMNASLACELLHAYLLIHDDFMDRDELRRGGPTLHLSLGAAHGAHLGASLALLLGSLCQSWAHELLLSSPVEPARLAAAARRFEEAIAEVTVGQMLDLLAARREPSVAEVLEIERRKTGGYTFELPLLLGAALAGGDARLDEALKSYARPLGQAFQIADDLLGTFGAEERTGKAASSDLREGKRTLLVVRTLERAAPDEAEALRAALRRGGLSDEEVRSARALMQSTGALGAARAEAQRLCDEALDALAALPEVVRAPLREIALYTVQRTS